MTFGNCCCYKVKQAAVRIGICAFPEEPDVFGVPPATGRIPGRTFVKSRMVASISGGGVTTVLNREARWNSLFGTACYTDSGATIQQFLNALAANPGCPFHMNQLYTVTPTGITVNYVNDGTCTPAEMGDYARSDVFSVEQEMRDIPPTIGNLIDPKRILDSVDWDSIPVGHTLSFDAGIGQNSVGCPELPPDSLIDRTDIPYLILDTDVGPAAGMILCDVGGLGCLTDPHDDVAFYTHPSFPTRVGWVGTLVRTHIEGAGDYCTGWFPQLTLDCEALEQYPADPVTCARSTATVLSESDVPGLTVASIYRPNAFRCCAQVS